MSWDDDLIEQLAREHRGERDELVLWVLVKDHQRAEARTRRHPLGIELVVTVDGEQTTSAVFEPETRHLLGATAQTIRLAMAVEGWQPAGPRPV
jgi:hypothetical protein